MDPAAFLDDVLAKPEHLDRLARGLGESDPWEVVPRDVTDVVFVGMGSSHYAASVVAARLRAKGFRAIAELASRGLLPREHRGAVVVAISASGGSVETLAAVEHYEGRCPGVLLTNSPVPRWAARPTSSPVNAAVAARSIEPGTTILRRLPVLPRPRQRKAASPVRAWPTTRVCISTVPS